MSLSLEVRRFVNSQHMGEFVDIPLDGELPATKDELRAVRRDNAAAAAARRKAGDAYAAKENAVRAYELAEKELKKAEAAVGSAEAALASAKQRESAIADKCAGLRSAVKDCEKTLAAAGKASAAPLNAGAAPDNGSAEPAGENAAEKTENASASEAVENTSASEAGESSEALRKRLSNLKRAGSKRLKELERLRLERGELEKQLNAAAGTPGEAELKKRLDSLDAGIEAKTARTDADRERIEALKAALKAAEAAEGSAGGTKNPGNNAEKTASAAKTADDAETAEMLLRTRREELENEEIKLKAASDETAAAETAAASAKQTAEGLRAKLAAAAEKRDNALKNSEKANASAEKLKNSVRSPQTKRETARIHYLAAGKGEPIILIHSAGQSLYTFRRIIDRLAMNYRVIAPDLVGHGYSDRPFSFDYTISDYAESLLRFMDALNIGTAHLLGFSMGAGFALELARKHPERIGRLVLLCPGGVTSSMPLTVRLMESSFFGSAASRLYGMRGVAKMLGECVFDQTVIDSHDIDEYYRPASDAGARYAIRSTVNRFDEEKLTSTLREIDAPALLLWGSEDRWHPISGGEVYVRALGSCESAVVRNAGHLFHEEKPERVCELIREFIPAGYGTDIY